MPKISDCIKCKGYMVQILVDGKPLPLYRPRPDQDVQHLTTRYLKGIVGKAFAVQVSRNPLKPQHKDDCASFTVRFGQSIAGSKFLLPGKEKCAIETINLPTAEPTVLQCVQPTFSPLLAFGTSSVPRQSQNNHRYGIISIVIQRGTLETKPAVPEGEAENEQDPVPKVRKIRTHPTLIDEKTVKGGQVDQQISYQPTGKTITIEEHNSTFCDDVFVPYKDDRGAVCTLELRYCSQGMLEALKIVPRITSRRAGRASIKAESNDPSTPTKATKNSISNTSPKSRAPASTNNTPNQARSPAKRKRTTQPQTPIKKERTIEDQRAWDAANNDSDVEVVSSQRTKRVHITVDPFEVIDD